MNVSDSTLIEITAALEEFNDQNTTLTLNASTGIVQILVTLADVVTLTDVISNGSSTYLTNLVSILVYCNNIGHWAIK